MQMTTLLVAASILTVVGPATAYVAEKTATDVEARSGLQRERPIVWPLGEELPEGLDQLAPAELREAMRRYRESGEATVIRQSDAVVYPFNESQPIVRCSPLRACDVELQAGEVVTGVAVGDSERWITSPLESGDLGNPTPHVIVKPKAWDLATNLVIATTRRTYYLSLVSPPKSEGTDDGTYYRHVRFYYPTELVQYWMTERQRHRRAEVRREEAMTVDVSALSVDQLNFDYTIKGDRKVAWRPTTVFDDGQHVYIQLPATARATDLPALLVEVQGGGMGISNYRVRGDWYVSDGLFTRAELVVGVGKKKRKVELINNRPPSGD